MNTRKTSSILIILGSSVLFFNLVKPAYANTVSNDNYSVDVNNIDTNPQPTPISQVLGITNSSINDFTTGPNYNVNSSNSYLSISLSQNNIDFGILSSTNPVIRTSKIIINGQLGGQVITYENHPLLSSTNDVIPNTSCDNGSCTPDIAALWINTLTYGFGYQCESNHQNICDPQFQITNYFKPFPILTETDSPETILETNNGQSQGSIIYKVNISGTQKTGGYYNSITYLAIPNF